MISLGLGVVVRIIIESPIIAIWPQINLFVHFTFRTSTSFSLEWLHVHVLRKTIFSPRLLFFLIFDFDFTLLHFFVHLLPLTLKILSRFIRYYFSVLQLWLTLNLHMCFYVTVITGRLLSLGSIIVISPLVFFPFNFI